MACDTLVRWPDESPVVDDPLGLSHEFNVINSNGTTAQLHQILSTRTHQKPLSRTNNMKRVEIDKKYGINRLFERFDFDADGLSRAPIRASISIALYLTFTRVTFSQDNSIYQ